MLCPSLLEVIESPLPLGSGSESERAQPGGGVVHVRADVDRERSVPSLLSGQPGLRVWIPQRERRKRSGLEFTRLARLRTESSVGVSERSEQAGAVQWHVLIIGPAGGNLDLFLLDDLDPLDHHVIHRAVLRAGFHSGDPLDDVVTLRDLAEDRVLSIEPGGRGNRHEEL